MFFLIIHGVRSDEPGTVIGVTQGSTTREVIIQALSKANKSSESPDDYTLMEEFQHVWIKQEDDSCPVEWAAGNNQRMLGPEEQPLEVQAQWHGDAKFILKKLDDSSEQIIPNGIHIPENMITDVPVKIEPKDELFQIMDWKLSVEPFVVLELALKQAVLDHLTVSSEQVEQEKDPESNPDSRFKTLKCGLCSLSFTNFGFLKHHITRYHETEAGRKRVPAPTPLYSCSTCSETFKHYTDYNDHQKKAHRPTVLPQCRSRTYRCARCFESFDNYEEYNAHRAKHKKGVSSSQSETYRNCVRCPESFKTYEEYNTHRQKSHKVLQSRSYSCDSCSESFENYEDFDAHRTKHHKILPLLRSKPYHCVLPNCPESFESYDEYNIHRKLPHILPFRPQQAHRKARHIPPLPPYQPQRKKPPVLPLPSHSYHCKTCDEYFDRKRSLKEHRRTSVRHSKRLPSFCKFCLKVFPSDDVMMDHIRSKHPKQVQCETCGSLFVRNGPSLKCYKCASFATSQSYLKVQKENFKCDACPRNFPASEKPDYLDHLVDHLAGNLRKCEACLKCYTRSTFEDHLKDQCEDKNDDKDPNGLPEETRVVTDEVPASEKDNHLETSVPTPKSQMDHSESDGNDFINSGSPVDTSGPIHEESFDDCLRKQQAGKPNHDTRIRRVTYKCMLCRIQFETQISLIDHGTEQHPEAKQFRCSSCSKLFLTKNPKFQQFKRCRRCRRKQLGISGKPPFYCPVCDKSFINRGKLNKHLDIHEIQSLKGTTTLDEGVSLNEVITADESSNISDGITPDESVSVNAAITPESTMCSTSDENIKCNFCPESFILYKDMIEHVMETHRDANISQCVTCGRSFTHPGSVGMVTKCEQCVL